jgi:secreted trypsin-like serine protease
LESIKLKQGNTTMKPNKKVSIALATSILLLSCSAEKQAPQSQIQYFAGSTPDLKADGPQNSLVALSMEQSPGIDSIYCSGVLVAPKIVMTAAHCLAPISESGPKGTGPAFLPNKIRISLPNGFKTEAVETKYPADFDMYFTYVYGLDVGYIVLKDAAPLQNVIRIASEDDVTSELSSRASPFVLKGLGYGQTGNNSNSAGRLNTLDVPFITNFGPLKDPASFELQKRNSTGPKGTLIEFLAGFSERSACHGDSGGGVFFEAKPGDWRLMGIASRKIGIASSETGNCISGQLSVVYSYAFAAANFIEQELRIKILK